MNIQETMRYSVTALLCVVCLVACGSRPGADTPVSYGYKIVNAWPHDTGAYTQGLLWYGGALYESTGEYGYSRLRRVELETGEIEDERALSDDFFAEGAAVLDGKIYQLTWHNGKAFTYDAATLAPLGSFEYRGEGWGLTSDGTQLYMSDGTANIFVRDPATFALRRTIVVRNAGRPVEFLNELEWIEGKIWANVFMSSTIVIIDPESGRVEGVVDFSGIASQLAITPSTDVMNGIAHDPATGRIFVTGKNWNKLFEIEIFKK